MSDPVDRSFEPLFRSQDAQALEILSKMDMGFLRQDAGQDPADLRQRVLQVAISCIGIPRDQVDGVVEGSFPKERRLAYYKDAAHALNATFRC